MNYRAKKDNKTISVSTGEMVIATKDGMGVKTTFDVNAENANWNIIKNQTEGPNANNSPTKTIYYVIAIIIFLIITVSAVIILKRRKK